jgi:hypothetical protein
MSTTAQYAAQPTVETAQTTAANTNRDGTGATVLIASGPATAAGTGVGKRISRISMARVVATAVAYPANVICFYISYDGGVTKRLLTEWPIPAYTGSTTNAQSIVYAIDMTGFSMPGSTGGIAVQLYASSQVAATTNITVESALL